MKPFHLIAAGLLLAVSVFAQNPAGPTSSAGRFTVSEYAGWTLHSMNNASVGSQTIYVDNCFPNLGTNVRPFFPLATNAPLTIVDGPNTETITPSQVNSPTPTKFGDLSTGQYTCSFVATFTKAHLRNVAITSATFGLEEAINDAHNRAGGVVVVDASWPGVTSMITVTGLGFTNVAIEDARATNGTINAYTWNGSVYVPGGGGGVAIALQHNGSPNSSQTVLNLAAGSGTTLADTGNGQIQISTTAGGGNVSTAPGAGVSQDVVQGVGTQFSATNFAGTRVVAANYNWSQSPAADLSSPGAKTVTLTPCPLGVVGSSTISYVYISGTGTPEAVLQTAGGTCTPGAASGTINFTTLNAHTAGYTVGSASQGIQEALNDTTSNANVWLVPAGAAGVTFTNAYTVRGKITIPVNNVSIWGGGAVLKCMTNDSCISATSAIGPVHLHDIRFASGVNNAGVAITNTVCSSNVATITSTLAPAVGSTVDIQGTFDRTYWGPHLVATSSGSSWTYACGSNIGSQATAGWNAYLTAVMEWNNQGDTAENIMITNPGGISGKFNNGIVVYGDEAAKIDWMFTNGNRCDGYCGQAVYMPGPFATNPPVVYLSNSSFSQNCAGNGVTDWAGNTVSVSNTVIQGFNKWGVSTGIFRGGFGPATLTNVYEEVGNCSNPDYSAQKAQAGLLIYGNAASVTGGEGPAGNIPSFGTGGSTTYNYYVVIHDSVLGASMPILAGTCLKDATGTCAVEWPRINGANTVTYDVIRMADTSPQGAPYTAICTGGSITQCGSVTTAQAQCSTATCTFSDNIANNTASYTVASPGYLPFLPFWPGAVVMAGTIDSAASAFGSTAGTVDLLGPENTPAPIISAAGNTMPSVFTQHNNNGSGASVIWIQSLENPRTLIGAGSTVGATILRTGPFALTGGTKGRLNFSGSNGWAPAASIDHIVTWVDVNPAKTINTAGYRPTYDANDTYFGIDGAAGGNLASAQSSYGSPVSHSFYVGNVGDGTNWLERLTASVKTFNVPIIFGTDNTWDIGAAGATRPRRVYAGTDFVGPIGATTPAAGTFTSVTIPASGGLAGGWNCGQGTANGHATANTITEECPASVTAYEEVKPGAAATGVYHATNAANVVTVSIGPVVAADMSAQYSKWLECTSKGLGDGLNAIAAGTYLQTTCKNVTGVTVTITGVQCFTDNNGTSTLNAAGNTLGALLTGAVTCTTSYAAGTQSANVALTANDYIKFTFVADGTSKQTDWIVTGTY